MRAWSARDRRRPLPDQPSPGGEQQKVLKRPQRAHPLEGTKTSRKEEGMKNERIVKIEVKSFEADGRRDASPSQGQRVDSPMLTTKAGLT